jgi:hypothetical protein
MLRPRLDISVLDAQHFALPAARLERANQAVMHRRPALAPRAARLASYCAALYADLPAPQASYVAALDLARCWRRLYYLPTWS